MAKKSSRFSIFSKQLLIMWMIVFISLLGLAYINFSIYQESRDNINKTLGKAATGLAENTATWVDMMLRVGYQNARLDEVASMDPQRMVPTLKTITDTYDWTYLTHVIDIEGHQIARSDGKSTFMDDGSKNKKYDRSSRAYFQQVRDGGEVGQQVVISKTFNKPALVLAVPIKNDAGETIGALARGSDLASISKAITDVRIGQSGYAILVDGTNKVIAHGIDAKAGVSLQDFSDHPALTAGKIGQYITFEERGEKKVGYVKDLGLGWKLIINQDYDDAFAQVQKLAKTSIIIAAVILLVLIILSVIFANTLVKPIRELTRAADEYSRGNHNVPMPGLKRNDEIGVLARLIKQLGAAPPARQTQNAAL